MNSSVRQDAPREEQDFRPLPPEELVTVEALVRGIVAARLHDRSDVDDVVQDVLERLLRARERIDPERLAPYAAVTTKNLLASRARRGKGPLDGAAALLEEPVSPAGEAEAAEDRDFLIAALQQLGEPERSWLLAHDAHGLPVAEVAPAGVSPVAMRARLTRARAKLRVAYAVVSEGVELPSSRCRPALVGFAAGARARTPAAERHLATCSTCARVRSQLERRLPPVVLLLPLLVLRRTLGVARSHPAAAGVAVAATGAAVALGVIGTSGAPHRHRVLAHPPPVVRVVHLAHDPTTHLYLGGRPWPAPDASLARLAGRRVAARGAAVEAVVTHNGFWVGPSRAHRIFVELVGPLRPLRVRVGERVSFLARLVGQSPGFPGRMGLSRSGGAAQLALQAAHLDVPTTAITFPRTGQHG